MAKGITITEVEKADFIEKAVKSEKLTKELQAINEKWLAQIEVLKASWSAEYTSKQKEYL